ncbi:MAG: mechanosensitive ion channel family protein [Prevotellaceae bacterium]|jgi:small-conductance mechanosensitive channel|nr:mechanosensitive ion channel family protein [Prevotellaceae bacterium]
MKLRCYLLAAALTLQAAAVSAYGEYSIGSAAAVSAPVAPFGDTLFILYGNLGGITVQKRAVLVAENIIRLKDDLLFYPDSLVVVNADEEHLVAYRGTVLVGLTAQQAAATGASCRELAQEYRDVIAAAVTAARAENTWLAVVKRLALALLVVAAAYFGIKYLNLSHRKLVVLLRRHKLRPVKSLRYLMDTNRQIAVGLVALRVVKYFLVVVVLYVCVLTLFRLFPTTRWLSDTLIGYITAPLKKIFSAVWDYLPNVFYIAIIVVLFRLIAKALQIIANKVGAGSLAIKGFQPDWAVPTYRILRVMVIVFALIFIFPFLPNSDSDIFKGVSVFVGLLLSLGSTSIISNIISGMVITYMNPFKKGDRIKMGEHVGDVVEKTALVTRLRTPKNELITIPNSIIMTAQTINYSNSAKDYGLILHAQVTMGYEVPWRRVHELLMEAGAKTQYVLQEPKPFVLQTALDDFYVRYQINIYTAEACKMLDIYSDLYANVQDVFHREGVEMVMPHIASVRDASKVSIPREYVRPGQEHTPPFRVTVEKK